MDKFVKVERRSLNPRCSFIMICLHTSVILIFEISENILEIMDILERDLKLFTSFLLPFLNIGVTYDCFHLSE